jgi:hypothetical protein
MILESKDGIRLDAVDKRKVTYYGTMTVGGTGEIKIPCRGRPLEVEVGFSTPLPPPTCGPIIDDEVEIAINHLINPFPIWAIKISWEIHSGHIRELAWRAVVVR